MANSGIEQKNLFSRLLFIVLTLAIPILFVGLRSPAFMDHEGRYAEVAREMLLTSDWLTPHLNFTIFLNKPPLPFWLTAFTFQLVGVNEYARCWVALSGFATVVVTFFFGRALAGPVAGFFSSVILLASGGFFLESRLLRPDMLFTLWITLALFGFLKTYQGNDNQKHMRWLCLSATSVALSVMTKGFLGILLVGGIVGGTLIFCGQLRFLRSLRWRWALAIAFAIILPWHFLVGLYNQGFWWDYFVNQHILFFFDRKFPRDSIPDSLTIFWGAFLGRTLPWCIFLPAVVAQNFRDFRRSRSLEVILPIVWLGVVVLFFSVSPSRLEHYSIPALPSVALITGCWLAKIDENIQPTVRSQVASCALLFLLSMAGLAFAPRLLANTDWTQEFPLLQQYALTVCWIAILSSLFAAGAFWWHHTKLAFAVLACSMAVQFLLIYHALVLIEPRNSWKPIGACIAEFLPTDGEVLFAATDEYQICGGLNFYSTKRFTIILPDGYIPPTYLTVNNQEAFITKAEALRRWQADRPVLLLIDPNREDASTLTIQFVHATTVGQWADQLLLANRNFAERVPLPYDFCTVASLSHRQR